MCSPAGVLIGKATYKCLTTTDMVKLSKFTSENISTSTQVPVASYFRSVFMPSHSHHGLQYRVGEFALVEVVSSSEFEDAVVRIVDIFAVKINGAIYNCIKGEVYPIELVADNGTEVMHSYSSSPVVFPSSEQELVLTSNVKRKLMLYPELENLKDPSKYIVIDYMRPNIPLKSKDVIVPFFPERGDMVYVVGDGADEPWLANVQSVNVASKTCQIHFYVETKPGSAVWQREHIGHRALETIHWASIVGLASGDWCGTKWKKKQAV